VKWRSRHSRALAGVKTCFIRWLIVGAALHALFAAHISIISISAVAQRTKTERAHARAYAVLARLRAAWLAVRYRTFIYKWASLTWRYHRGELAARGFIALHEARTALAPVRQHAAVAGRAAFAA